MRRGELGMLSEPYSGDKSRSNLARFSRHDEGFGFYSKCEGALWSFEQRRNDLVTYTDVLKTDRY